MGKNILFSFMVLWILTLATYSQTPISQSNLPIFKKLQEDGSPQQVQIFQDRRIDSLLLKYVNGNLKKKSVPGFRIRILSVNNQDNGRQRATEAKSKFITNFPGIGAEIYIIYESPEWKVYLGDFRTRTDAYRVKIQISSIFPNNRVVESQIDYSKL